jgi:hypothetical protein
VRAALSDRPGDPVLRLREGRPVSIDIRNDTDIDDIIHWHGLYVPSVADGAMEEGSPMVERGGTQRYTFLAKPTGTRWYHSHNPAEIDLSRSLYGGLYGFMIIEPTGDPGRYDREVLLAAHHWEGSWGQHAGHPQGPRATTDSKCFTHRRLSTTTCLDTVSRSACKAARSVPPYQQARSEHDAGARRESHDRRGARCPVPSRQSVRRCSSRGGRADVVGK